MLLLRHVECFGNELGLTCGRVDRPLTYKGRCHASRIGKRLTQEGHAYRSIFHGSLSRTEQTARLIAAAAKWPAPTFHRLPELDERDWGKWEGRRFSEVLKDIDSGQEPPDGESVSEYRARCEGALRLVAHLSCGVPLVVSHGGLFHMLGGLLGQTLGFIGNGEGIIISNHGERIVHFR